MTNTTQPDARRLALHLRQRAKLSTPGNLDTLSASAANELERQHARIAELDPAEAALTRILRIVQNYLPRDSKKSARDALSDIIAEVDPWPVGMAPLRQLERQHAELSTARAEAKHWRSNHDNVAARLRVFTQRPDLPKELADRLPWYRELVRLQEAEGLQAAPPAQAPEAAAFLITGGREFGDGVCLSIRAAADALAVRKDGSMVKELYAAVQELATQPAPAQEAAPAAVEVPAAVAVPAAIAPGMKAAADLVQEQADLYITEHAETDPDTGAVIWHHRDFGFDWHNGLEELAQKLLARAALAAAPAQAVPSGMWTIWESLPGYLIDHCEGDVITEEGLQRALEAMLKNPKYSMPPAAAAPAPKATGTAHLPYFSYDEDAGVQFWATQERAIKECQDAIDAYREDVEDGWPDDVASVRWGAVLGRAVKTDERPDGSCDYALTPYAAPAQEHATQLAGQGLLTWDALRALAIKHGAWVSGYGPFAAELLATYGRAPEDQPHWVAKWLAAARAARAAPAQAQEDAVRLDHLQQTGSTVDLLPGEGSFYPMRFRVGGLNAAVSTDIRTAIDAARAAQGGA